ncbi:MAG: four helix bundle protein [Bacteroidales bacterium]|jgi:four helix bundle protein
MEVQKVYDLSMDFSQKIWDLVSEWPSFARDTNGKQIVRSSDSISANLKEGLGRYSFKDRNLFNIYSRGSLFETHCWLEKAIARKLISKEDFDRLINHHDFLHFEINKMIKNTREQTFR